MWCVNKGIPLYRYFMGSLFFKSNKREWMNYSNLVLTRVSSLSFGKLNWSWSVKIETAHFCEIGIKERGYGQDALKGKEPGWTLEGGEGGAEPSHDRKHSYFKIGSESRAQIDDALSKELHHPIMSKLWDSETEPTYRYRPFSGQINNCTYISINQCL